MVDLAGLISQAILDGKAAIEARYASLGLKAKLKFAEPGERLEFVGLHMLIGEKGITQRWCPDLARSLSKMSNRLGRKNFKEIAVSTLLQLRFDVDVGQHARCPHVS